MSQNRKWDKDAVIRSIRQRERLGKGLNPQSVRADDMGLYLAAFRYVGSWKEALTLAGVSEAYLRRQWDEKSIMAEVRRRAIEGLPINPGAVQNDDPGLWRAAHNRFGSWASTLINAGYDPNEIYIRRKVRLLTKISDYAGDS